MRENYKKSIASMKKFPQFTTMNVIDGQAGLIICASLIFYSLTIDNILNIIVLLILAGVSIATLTGDEGIIGQAVRAKEETEIAGIKEEAELVKLGMFQVEKEIERNELLEKLKEHFKGTQDGNRIITKDEDYAIFVKNDDELTIEVIKNQEGILAEGEFDLKVEVIDGYKIILTPVVGGEQTYGEYSNEILQGKSNEEKIDMFMSGTRYWEELAGREFNYATFEEYMIALNSAESYPKTLEEYCGTEYKNVEYLFKIDRLANPEGYEFWEEVNTEFTISETNGWTETENMDYGEKGYYFGYCLFYANENKDYTFTATWGENVVTKTVSIDDFNTNTITSANIYEYDTTTGYITGVKSEYLKTEEIVCNTNKYLSTGLTKLVIPSEINGTTIVGIDQGAFSGIYNLVAIELPNTITEIGENAFEDCRVLTEVIIPDSVTKIGYRAFYNSSILEVFIPNTVTTVGDCAFELLLKDAIINCEAESKPTGWSSYWNGFGSNKTTANFGQTRN